MSREITIGGERLGSGKKMKAYMHGYERSTHDLSYIWRSTMSSGTIVPFMSKVALAGDTWDIELQCEILTHPTIGPLFGSWKVQLDIFLTPIRLYNAQLHMNQLNIGRDMSKIKLPIIQMEANGIRNSKPIDNQQINPSSIFSYLGIRGAGVNKLTPGEIVYREFNAVPLLNYWEIVKNYYANKQEDYGMVIHKVLNVPRPVFSYARLYSDETTYITLNLIPPATFDPDGDAYYMITEETTLRIQNTGGTPDNFDPSTEIELVWKQANSVAQIRATLGEMFSNISSDRFGFLATTPTEYFLGMAMQIGYIGPTAVKPPEDDTAPNIVKFPLENIDTMRKQILTNALSFDAYEINSTAIAPYGLALEKDNETVLFSKEYAQEGLALKTYNSDLFNNWINTEWIDGVDGVSAVTAIDTSGGSFTIDELNLSQKVYNMLNRIALSGGSYDDWLDAVYTHDRVRSIENPVYQGGLIKELVFQEVISNAASEDQPLGTLAGRGKLSQKHKGGKVVIKVDEPSYIMGVISLTPRLDYSQGNSWDVNLKSLNDLHKPALDEIGFQDLITDQMAWWDTVIDTDVFPGTPIFKSAGKQPAWINYMTSVNEIRGNFADQRQQMFMVLNRRYEPQYDTDGIPSIADLTTYIDPTKFNQIFSNTRLDAQNFWAQIGVNAEVRRKMSAKIIPNL